MKQTFETIRETLSRIDCQVMGWKFDFLVKKRPRGFSLQVFVHSFSGLEIPREAKGGKHYISEHATESEVLLKAWKAVKDFLVYEAHNSFKVDEVKIFDPHLKISALVEAIKYMPRQTREGEYTPQKPLEDV